VAWAEEKTVRVLDIPSDEMRLELTLPDYVHWLLFADDGQRLMVRCGTFYVVDVAAGKQLFRLGWNDQGPQWPKLSVTQTLAIDTEHHLWALATNSANSPPRHSLVRISSDGQLYETLIADLGLETLGQASLSTDRKLLAVAAPQGSGTDQRWQPCAIDVWDVASASKRQRLAGHWNEIEDVVFSGDGKKLATAAYWSDVIKIWSLEETARSPAP
jgi:WD40 repeat protein